jgi:FkbM family methyltransferase
MNNYIKRVAKKLLAISKDISVTQKRRQWKQFVQGALSHKFPIAPLTLVDVGASGELPDYWRDIDEYLRVIGFEPDEKAYKELMAKEEKNRRYIPTALAEKPKEASLFITRKQMVSSMLRPNRKVLDEFPNSNRFDIIETQGVKTDTLDNALRNENADFIKLDTQGNELFILQGALETLRNKILGVEVEVEFTDMYENQPLFGEVDSLLRQSNFVLLDFIQISRWKRKSTQAGKGQLIFADALYLKAKDSIIDKTKLLKAVAICALYGHFDYAISLLQEGITKNVIDTQEYKFLLGNLHYNSKAL